MTQADVALRQVSLGAAAPAARPAPTPRDAMRGDHEPSRSLYIHIPFCAHKCHYCDFYSFVDADNRQGAFTDALAAELRTLARFADAHAPGRPTKPRLETIFIGGGTPSLLALPLWQRLLETLRAAFDLSAIDLARPGAEFTVECNPESSTPELFALLRAGGVTRVSMGAQSFHEARLRTLERIHTPGAVARALSAAAAAGIRRRSIDLIYAIPGQTLDEWRHDVESALALQPSIEHLSCYSLTYEPNTAMTKRLERAEFERCDEDLEAEMYEWTVARLRDAGFERYEVSNFARGVPARSAHNLAYWRQQSWLAAGPSASAHLRLPDPRRGGWRWKNIPRLGDWLESVRANDGWSSVVDLEPPDPARALRERIMMGLRLSDGLDANALFADAALLRGDAIPPQPQTPLPPGEDVAASATGEGAPLHAAIDRRISLGHLTLANNRLALTDAGFLFADGVARDLMRAIRTAETSNPPPGAAASSPG